MAKINTYLNFDGKAEEAFEFYQSVWGGSFSDLQRFGDADFGANMSADDQQKIMHIALPLTDHHVLMGSDYVEGMGKPLAVGNNFHISIQAESKEEADRLFSALSDGGTIDMPLQDMFWGAYFGMLSDRYGVQWMINFDRQAG